MSTPSNTTLGSDSGALRYVNVMEFFHALGLCKTKFYELLKEHQLPTPGKLLSPEQQNYYRQKLGFPPFWTDTPS